ncbi:MAG TPA: hypothetical protein VJJ26_02650 [Candidatus Babeliales bacterium]|nr:hypothetical protein [Candidatus Babeliales bacterium]
MNTFEHWQQSLLKNIQLQLFISFMSLPFLVAWGLPISLLTPVSTVMFGPFLTCFLLISSLIFFLELFYLPNGALIWCLEKVTSAWLACLSLEQRAWLIGFSKPPLIVLLLIPLIALAIIHSKKITCIFRRICLLALFLIAVCTGLKLFPYAYNTFEKVPCNKGDITLVNHNKTLIMIDPGCIASRPSYESLISYSLIPAIVQKTGLLQIDHLIVFKFNKRILDALQFLVTKITIKDIYLPRWNGRIPSFAWRSYVKLKKTVAENNGRIMSISYKKQLYLDKTSTLSIEPVATKDVSYYDATYRPLCVQGTINNQTLVL